MKQPTKCIAALAVLAAYAIGLFWVPFLTGLISLIIIMLGLCWIVVVYLLEVFSDNMDLPSEDVAAENVFSATDGSGASPNPRKS